MTLGDLIERVGSLVPLDGVGAAGADVLARDVTSIAYDSRQVAPGAVFVALRGQKAEGTAFAEQAVSRGAIAVVADDAAPGGITVPWLRAPDARRAMAAASAVFFDRPSERLAVVGVTGTNGKTTTTYLLASIFEAAGWRTGVVGTIGHRIGRTARSTERTTPEAPDVQRLLREMADAGCAACVMEVSSHALALRRVDFVRFSAALFTNLTRDHLDFHSGMEEYFGAKRRLFEMLDNAPMVVNVDDPYGERLAGDFPRAIRFAIDRPADVAPGRIDMSLGGLRFEARTPRGTVAVRSRLVGRPNAYNILGAIGLASALDVPLATIASGIAALGNVPGRFQTVSAPGADVTVIVDYAHTDDALKNLLETARPLASGRLITVFGCGGDRDRTKRPLMGAVAARLSDVVVITSDNPRSEDPAAIVEEIKKGVVPPERPARHLGQPVAPVKAPQWLAIVDRAEAIARAVEEAHAGDVVVVAGKGHERYQVIGERVLPFDDVEMARAALERRRLRARTVGKESA